MAKVGEKSGVVITGTGEVDIETSFLSPGELRELEVKPMEKRGEEPMTHEEIAEANAELDAAEEGGLTLGEAAQQAVEAGNAVIAAAQVSLAAKEEKEKAGPSEREEWELVLSQLNQRDTELTEDWNKAQDKKLKAAADMDTAAGKRLSNAAAILFVAEKLKSLPVEDGLPLWEAAKKGGSQVPEAGEVKELTPVGGGTFEDAEGKPYQINPETGEMELVTLEEEMQESEEDLALAGAVLPDWRWTGQPAEGSFRLAPDQLYFLDSQDRPCLENVEKGAGKMEVIEFTDGIPF